MTLEERQARLSAIAAEIKVCTKCPLHEGRTHAVPGAGPTDAEIMFIGEGPGFNEDKQGLPFVGQSGHLLEQFLAIIGMKRDEVFISNVVKCRPPGNRDPLPGEIETCTSNYLYKQIEVIDPRIIVTLGRYSMGLFFPKAKITQIHGQPKTENGRIYLPMFHPAAVLRNMESMKQPAEADFKKIPGLLVEARKLKSKGSAKNDAEGEPPTPTQLSLF